MTPEELAAADKDSAVIVCDYGTSADGRPYWVYLAVKPSMYKQFLKETAAHRPISFEEYGEILKYGYDQEVPLAVKEEMKLKYNFDDQYMAKLTQKVIQAQIVFFKNKETQRIGDIVAMLKKKQ